MAKKSGRIAEGVKKASAIKLKNRERSKVKRPNKAHTRRVKKETDTRVLRKQNSKGTDIDDIKKKKVKRVKPESVQDGLNVLQNYISNRSFQLLGKMHAPEAEPAKPSENISDAISETDDSDSEDSVGKIDEIEKSYNAKLDPSGKEKRMMLPIKTASGLVVKEIEIDEEESEEDESSMDESDQENEETLELPDTPVTTAELIACREELLNQRKLRIGTLCTNLLSNPTGFMHNFQQLFGMMDEKIPEVKTTVIKLATVSLLEVFKDILPSYVIVNVDKTVQMKKEVFELKQQEEALLNQYQTYLTKLECFANDIYGKGKRDQGKLIIAETAVKCMGELLVHHPYFNFSTNLAQCLVKFMDNCHESIRKISKEAIQKVFKNDKRGYITLQIVRRINILVKDRGLIAHTEPLEVLLALRIKDINLDKEKEKYLEQEKLKARKMKLLQNSRRDKKRQKKMEELERDLMATNAEEDKQQKLKYITEVVKVVFTIYFRILKKEPDSSLLSVALEGLAKYASCINLEFYHDLVNALDHLIVSGELQYRDHLHIVQTVFAILSGQAELVTIDPRRFYTELYCNMMYIHAGDSHSDMLTLVKAVDYMMIKRRKMISNERSLAFTKRLATMALQVLHNGSLSCLSQIKSMLQLNKSTDLLLEVEKTTGQGVFDPLVKEPEYSYAGNSTLWELSLLQRHYHPVVQQYAHFVSAGAPETGSGSLSLDLTKQTAMELFVDYDGSAMAFKPAIPPPQNVQPKMKPSRYYIANGDLDQQVKSVLEAIPLTGNFFKAVKKSW